MDALILTRLKVRLGTLPAELLVAPNRDLDPAVAYGILLGTLAGYQMALADAEDAMRKEDDG